MYVDVCVPAKICFAKLELPHMMLDVSEIPPHIHGGDAAEDDDTLLAHVRRDVHGIPTSSAAPRRPQDGRKHCLTDELHSDTYREPDVAAMYSSIPYR